MNCFPVVNSYLWNCLSTSFVLSTRIIRPMYFICQIRPIISFDRKKIGYISEIASRLYWSQLEVMWMKLIISISSTCPALHTNFNSPQMDLNGKGSTKWMPKVSNRNSGFWFTGWLLRLVAPKMLISNLYKLQKHTRCSLGIWEIV